jgi:hypothetical protein
LLGVPSRGRITSSNICGEILPISGSSETMLTSLL